MMDLQHITAVDEAPATREEVGGEDIVERDGDMVEEALMEIVAVGVVSNSFEHC